jgi:hypothetical protein
LLHKLRAIDKLCNTTNQHHSGLVYAILKRPWRKLSLSQANLTSWWQTVSVRCWVRMSLILAWLSLKIVPVEVMDVPMEDRKFLSKELLKAARCREVNSALMKWTELDAFFLALGWFWDLKNYDFQHHGEH